MNRVISNPSSVQPENLRPVVWVTGSGAKRVGQSVAAAYANLGYRIALHANSSVDQARAFQEQLEEAGVESMLVTGGVESSKFADHAVQSIIDRFGRLDALVHSAAVWDWKPLEEVEEQDVRRQIDVNTLGAFFCAKAAGLAMCKQSFGGSIVLIGDWAVSRPYPNFSAYFAGKGAIETMTRSLAVELATRNCAVRVNAILPGPVLLDDSIPLEKAERIKNQSLLKRLGTPADVANAAIFLSQQPFITGVSLPVDGGRSIYAGDSLDAIAHPTFSPGPIGE